MRKFICQRPSTFGGKSFIIGEEISSELIEPSRVKTLLKYGTITSVEVPDAPTEQPETEPEQPDEGAEGTENTGDDEGESKQPDAEQKQEEEPAKPAKKGGRK